MGKRGYGSLIMKHIKCSLPAGKHCKCQDPKSGFPHGPYFYHVISMKGKQHWIYLGRPDEAIWKILTNEDYGKDWQDHMIEKFKNLTSTSNIGKSHPSIGKIDIDILREDLTNTSNIGKISFENGKLIVEET